MPDRRPNCRRWMWIELIGFDNTEPDYHVSQFLDNAGFIPDVVSFHLCCPDFINDYQGMAREVALPPDNCSYAGRPYNAERSRQGWTNYQFRGLVQALQQRGVKVYCSVMDAFHAFIDGAHYRSPWCHSHPELWAVRHAGQDSSVISPLKRLADGSYFEDHFVSRLREVVADYGFDGFHGADGMSGPRLPIWHGDYSDDMIGQFAAMMSVDVDLHCDGDPERAEARARCIWANLRREWCEFHARRWEQMWTKICAAMRQMGKATAFNNVWTQEPFAALHRYGLDYRRIANAGVDAFITETVGAGNEIGAEGVPADLRANLNMMLLFAKAYLPDSPLTCLNCTGDTTENWDVLNHAPPVCEREHYTLGSLFLQDAAGFHRASAGPVVCLADGIEGCQWRWMGHNWEVAYEATPTRVLGATIVWSEAAHAAEFDDYVAHRTLTRHRLCTELSRRGAPLLSIVNLDDLEAASGCLLVPRPELLPESELARLRAYDRGPVVMIGRGSGEQLSCQVLGRGDAAKPSADESPEAPVPEEIPEPPNYLHDLWCRPVGEEFLGRCAALLIELSETPRVINGLADARVLAYETAPNLVRLLVGNEAHYYIQPQIDLGREIQEVRIASHFPGRPIAPDGATLTARVPPRGMVVLDVQFKTATE